MSNTLVVYYSLTSHTRQIAEAIAAAHDADLEVIEDTFNRDIGLGRPRSAIEGLLGLRSSITPPKHDLSEYDLVVMGFFSRVMTVLFAKPPAVAGEPNADLMLSHRDRSAINGALFKLDKRVHKPNKAMNDAVFGKRLWDELARLTTLTPE